MESARQLSVCPAGQPCQGVRRLQPGPGIAAVLFAVLVTALAHAQTGGLSFPTPQAIASVTPDQPPASQPRNDAAHASLRILVPAYFYPAGEGLREWDRLLAAADDVPIAAIVNPASGPGKGGDPNYVTLLRRARKTKLTLIGYVPLSYAKRPLADVRADVDTWLRHYPDLDGILFDEQPSAA